MVQQDIRWIQRFSNYRKALAKLSQVMAIMSEQLAFNDGRIIAGRHDTAF